jgi:hypothetical protein
VCGRYMREVQERTDPYGHTGIPTGVQAAGLVCSDCAVFQRAGRERLNHMVTERNGAHKDVFGDFAEI